MKRLFDFIAALFGLLLLSPVMLLVSVLIRIKLGSPILFTQDRPGLQGHVFKMMKFRTMLDDKGWAQVNGRNAISWDQKFEFDVWYVDKQSFWLDMKILFLTVKKVFVREGISSNDHVTMSEFKGNKNEN